jgi:hypothetical protein
VLRPPIRHGLCYGGQSPGQSGWLCAASLWPDRHRSGLPAKQELTGKNVKNGGCFRLLGQCFGGWRPRLSLVCSALCSRNSRFPVIRDNRAQDRP